MINEIYLDNAATTPVSREVYDAMQPAFSELYGNSNSIHGAGRAASAIVENARDIIAKSINANSNEIYFTSGGTEANNTIVRGIASANLHKGNHIITSKIEHHSVLDTCKQMEKEGYEVTYLDVDEYGIIDFVQLLSAIKPTTTLISIIAANNEIGTIQNIKAIAKTAKEKGITYHIDAVQLIGHLHIDVEDLGIDAMSMSAHKICGPKGIGAMYIKNNIRWNSLLLGGAQERGKRAGTINVPNVAGFGKAVEIAMRDFNTINFKLKKLSEYFLRLLTIKIDDIKINGHPLQRLMGIVSVSFEGIEGESILTMLDLKNIYVSTGSACSSNTLSGSHVIKAIRVPYEWANGTIRFSFSQNNSYEDIDTVVNELVDIVERLRIMSPIYKKRKK